MKDKIKIKKVDILQKIEIRKQNSEMAEKIKKSIPWFLVIALLSLVTIAVLDLGKPTVKASSEQATTSVSVGNDAPTSFVVYELPEGQGSATTTPTNVGSVVTWNAKADDPNGDQWFLVICTSSDAISTSSAPLCPTCAGGTWATTTANDNATATATYTTLAGNNENNAWWAWACDNSADQKCASVSQGTGATDAQYSPFAVNHRPLFTLLAGTTPINPGGAVGISATSSDQDSGSSDWVQLTVCWDPNTTISGWGSTTTGASCASGGTLCAASSTANPYCTYVASSTLPDTTYTYYGYIIDNHSFAPSLATRSAQFVVNNITPAVINVVLNSGNVIDSLLEEGTTTIFVTADIQDSNSCNDGLSATTKTFRTASSSFCTAQNDNFCYYDISCTMGPCDSNSDDTATTSCSVYFWYYAQPTVASTPWVLDNWTAQVKGIDNQTASSTATSSAIEMETMLGVDIADTGTINYGTLSAGQTTVKLKRNLYPG